MPLLIMQQRQRTSPQDFARTSDESTRDQTVSIDGFAMTIDVKAGNRFLCSLLAVGFPQLGRPGAKGARQGFASLGFGQLARDPARYGNSRRREVFLSPRLTPFRCILVGHVCDASCPEAGTAAEASVDDGKRGNWRAESEQWLAHRRR